MGKKQKLFVPPDVDAAQYHQAASLDHLRKTGVPTLSGEAAKAVEEKG